MQLPSYAILSFLLLLTSCNGAEHQSQSTTDTVKKPDTVKVFRLQSGIAEKQTTLPGELQSYERVELRSKVTGYLKSLRVDIGSTVRKGQVVAILDAPEINSKAQEASAKALEAKARMEASGDNYNRVLAASKTEGVISAGELQRAHSQMQADAAGYNAASSAARSNKQTGSYLTLSSPINGIVTERNVDVGTFIGNPADKPIVVIEDNSHLRLRVAMPEALTGIQVKERKVKFTTKSYPNQPFEGTLMRKAGSINQATRSEVWEFDVANKDGLLRPGSFADVTMQVSRPTTSYLVPFSAVVTTLERKFVIRIKADTSQWIDVSQGMNLSDKTEVFGSISEGDTLVLKGNEELKEGTGVIPKIGR